MAIYTPEERLRRDRSRWTPVQAILAPIQLLAFLVSVVLVIRYLITGEGYWIATISVLIKISLLWAITVTGMFWEKEVFGHWFLAPQFFWEDVGNAVAMITHNLYFVAQWLGWAQRDLMALMLLAYTTYLVNCAQFVLKGVRSAQERRREARA